MDQQASYPGFGANAAENYERFFVPAIATPVAVDLLDAAALQPGERVLDVACGTGVIARFAAERVGPAGTVVGVDVSPEMIGVARTTPPPAHTAIEWREGDATSLPLPDDAFDAVLCQMGLMFVGDKPAALSEMRRVLAPGGRLALNTPGMIQRPLEILAEGLDRHISPDLGGFVRVVFSMDDPSELERLLEDAGFRDIETKTTTTELRLPPPAEFLWQYINLTPMGAFVNNAPDEARVALEEDVAGRSKEFVDEGTTVVRQPMVLATARI